MEDSQEKDYCLLGNDTFPNLNDALVYERKFKSEYLERQIYERLLKSEPSIVKFIENQSEHLSKLTYIILKNVLQGDLDVLVNRAEFIIFIQSRVPLGPGKWHVVVLVTFLIIHMKKLLDSDWLRAVQFKCNTSAKSVTPVQKV